MSLQRYIYLLLIFLLPTQLGKHFWPPFSFVGGFRVDYLSPTLYVTDILIIILAIVCLYRWAFYKRTNYEFNKKHIITGLFFLILLIGVVFAKNQPIAIYGLVKLLEMVFFGWYTARVVGKAISLKELVWAFGLGVLFESLLAVAQFLQGGSLGGVFYFFGERTFSAVTPGIANASIHGQLVLRPYGTLPHPNVLAGYLLLSLLFLASQWEMRKNKSRLLLLIVLLVGAIGIFLTLSRTAILLFLFFLFIGTLILKRKAVGILGIVGVVGIAWGVGGMVLSRFMSTSVLEESFVVRSDLLQNAWWMLRSSPLFGVGLMNFLVRLPSYQHTQSFYLHLQPVHNIFLLLLAEVGMAGFLGVLGFLLLSVRHVWHAPQTPLRLACLCMLCAIFFLGMLDHYFITLQQGQLLTAFTLGLCWSLPGYSGKRIGVRVKKKRALPLTLYPFPWYNTIHGSNFY